jgi:hypothetical protein
MAVPGRGETSSTLSRERPESGFLGRLRQVALIAVLFGAVGSLGLLLRAVRHNDSKVLLVLMAIWVLSPFMALLGAHVISKNWSVPTRATVYGVMLVVTLGSLVVYGADALWPFTAKAAFVFVLVPPLSWLVAAIAVPITALISQRLPRRD